MNPWMSIYYMVTGKNSSGDLINAGQTIERGEALRLYTRDNAWFIKEDSALGSIEAGKGRKSAAPNQAVRNMRTESGYHCGVTRYEIAPCRCKVCGM